MKKTFLAFILISFSFLLCGCFNYTDIEDKIIVSGLAVDIQKSGDYTVTAEIITASSSEKVEVSSEKVSADGKTVFAAMENLELKSGKPFDFSQCRIIFISEEVAKNKISEIVSLAYNYAKIRLSTLLAVVSSKKAADVFDSKIPLYDMTSYGICEMLKENGGEDGFYSSSQIFKCYNTVKSEGKEAVLPIIKVSEDENKTCAFSGTKLFRNDKTVGKINKDESTLLLFMNGKNVGGSLTLYIDEKNLSFEVKDFAYSINFNENAISFSYDMTFYLASRSPLFDYDLSDINDRNAFEKKISSVLKKNLEDFFIKIRDEYKTDVFGLGNMIYHKNPTLWQKIKNNYEKVFSETEIILNIKTVITDSGRTFESIG